jgi:hypothetical protein
MERIGRHVWSIVSITTTIATSSIVYSIIEHYYRLGTWNAHSVLAHKLSRAGMSAVLLSFVTGFVAVFRERPQTYGAIALLLSIVVLHFYVLCSWADSGPRILPADLHFRNPRIPYSYVLSNPLSAIDPNGLDYVFPNDSGNGIETIDNQSNAGECQHNEGDWAAGTITNVGYDPNSNDVLLGYANLGDNGNVDYSQITSTPG